MGALIPGMVSVVIPTYKRAETLVKAIDTTLAQSYEDIEVLVVNDNTKGDDYSCALHAILARYPDKRLHLIEQDKHVNGAAARNAGIRQARGEFIAFLDDDDYWEPQKLERQVKLLSSLDTSWGAVSCLMRIYSHGRLISSSLPYRDGAILLDLLDRRTSMGTGALLIRRTALDDCGYFDESLERHQDLQLFARLAAKYKIKLDRAYLHNRENKDAQNRPSLEQLKGIKASYFRSIQDLLDTLPPSDLRKVYIMHDFECAYAFLKNGRVQEGLEKMFGIFKSPATVYLALERTLRRIAEAKGRFFLQRKYALSEAGKTHEDRCQV